MRARLIYEKFEEKSDPIKDMGIGVEYQMRQWLKHLSIDNRTIDSDNDDDALIYSSGYGKIEFVEYLLDKYSLEYFKDKGSWENALPWAAEHGYYEIVKMLYDYGFDPSVLNNYALIAASRNKYFKIVKLLEKDPRVIEENKRIERNG